MKALTFLLALVPGWIRENEVLPWGALFVALCLAVTQYGGTNAASRVAASRAITEGGVLHINNYRSWTVDWSLSPNGYYYSNKAPGAMLLGLPMFALTDVYFQWKYAAMRDARGRVPVSGYIQHVLVMLWLQIVPFFLLVLWICWRLPRYGVGEGARHFFALAALFGNTAAIYMNCHFGHGVAALLFLAALFSWLERRNALAGAFLGFSLLSDYGVAFALPFFLLAALWRERSWRSLAWIGAGAAAPAAIWIWYHTVAFGSPFATANQFINPAEIRALPGKPGLWGGYSPLPSLPVLGELLFGAARGLLFTQPWVLALFVLPFLRTPTRLRGLALLMTGGLCGLLWMNSGFGSWEGGWCVGPRYLSSAFPAAALAVALQWDSFPRWLRPGLWALLAIALVFRLLVFPFSNLAPAENLWAYHMRKLAGPRLGTTSLRLGIALVLLSAALYWQKERGLFTRRKGVPVSPLPV